MKVEPTVASAAAPVREPQRSAEPGVGEVFADVLRGARRAETEAETAAVRFADGDPRVGIHEVVIAAEKANVQVRFAGSLKNRVLEAYRELMNTPV